MKKLSLTLVILFLLLSACSGAADPTLLPNPTGESANPTLFIETPPEAARSPLDNPQPSAEVEDLLLTYNSPNPSAADKVVHLALGDLARRLGIEISAVTHLSSKPIVWPDATLGCGKPGMDFWPIETPGFILNFAVGEQTYTYHTDSLDRVVLCPGEGQGPDEIFIMP